MTTPKTQSRFDLARFFVRGESLVATTGAAFIAILAFAIGGVVWISARTIDDSIYAQTDEKIREISTLIASQSELRLSDHDLPGLRRLMLDAVASGLVEECEISVPSLGVLASSISNQSVLSEIPETWLAPAVADHSINIMHDDQRHLSSVHESLEFDGKSGLVLSLVMDQSAQVVGSGSIRASSLGIMSVGMVLVLFVYRRFRNRLGALAGIGDALKAVAEGERRMECLLVGENLGLQAKAWNTLLFEHEELEQKKVDQEIVQASSGGLVESIGLPAACNTLTQGVLLLDSDLRVVYANGAACVFLRVAKDEFIDQALDTAPESEQIINAVHKVLKNDGSTREVIELGDVKTIESQGAILRVVITRVESDDVRRAMVFIDDVTQQRLADESQNAFIAQATHELRTPLTTIRLYTEEAIESGPEDQEIREKALNVINSESRRLERIVGDMLCVAEIEAGSLSIHQDSLRTEQLFQELEEDYQAQAKDKSIEMVFDLPPKFPTIQADRDRLGQALHNLVGNAIKYTPSGGKIQVHVSFADNNAMKFEVIDTGIGIDESQHERIFDRFCRADDRRIAKVTGSGLGLALARQIARLHGGDVHVESEIDKGSIFTLTIPGTQEIAKAA
ncbi:MAG: PAS domain-containing protein [Phycisphaerales bacterium]|nr:PAS domain-containing protein [Phycisphaerales bacterium]